MVLDILVQALVVASVHLGRTRRNPRAACLPACLRTSRKQVPKLPAAVALGHANAVVRCAPWRQVADP